MNAFLKRAVLILVLLLSGYINTGYGEKVCIKKVIDGDTIILKSGKRVRFIGIDAPEKYDGNKMVRNSRAWKLDKERIKVLAQKAYQKLEDADELPRTMSTSKIQTTSYVNCWIIHRIIC